MEFEYDPNKSASNKVKHGVDFEEAQTLWNDPKAKEIPLGYEDELRHAVIGEMKGKRWTAIITYRGESVRIISVRRSHKKEEGIYEDC